MKYFDIAAKIVERHFPALVSLVNAAALFDFKEPPQDFLPKQHGDLEKLRAAMFLPFPVVAAEDACGVVVLWDEEVGSVGPDHTRYVIACLPVFPDNPEHFRDTHERPEEAAAYERQWRHILCEEGRTDCDAQGRAVQFMFGSFRTMHTTDTWHEVAVDVKHVCVCVDGDIVVPWSRCQDAADPEGAGRVLGTSARTGIEEMIWVNQPDRFIVENAPVKVKQQSEKAKRTRVQRSHLRSTFTVLSAHAARAVAGLEMPHVPGGKKRPHDRRAHLRYLKSERYGAEKRGTWVHVRSSWVGPKEAVRGNRRYRVITDLPSVVGAGEQLNVNKGRRRSASETEKAGIQDDNKL